MKVVAGSRKSELAMMQTNFVKAQLEKSDPNLGIDIVGISTIGDKILDVALSKIGEKSLFTKELEVALMKKEVQFVVHSLKDLPTTLPDKMVIAAVLESEDPRDAVVIKKSLTEKYKNLSQLPKGAVIGSSSLRRQAQLKKKYPHLVVKSIRGNLNTRLKKLDAEDGEYSAIILAAAGLNRMATQNKAFIGRMSSALETDECLYAVGQGALAIEIDEKDDGIAKTLNCLHHEETCLRVVSERSFMKHLDGGCSSPMAVKFTIDEGKMTLKAGVFSVNGDQYKYSKKTVDLSEKRRKVDPRQSYTGILAQNIESYKMESALQLGIDVADDLLKHGAAEIIAQTKIANKPEPQRTSSYMSRCPFPKAKELTKSLLM